MGSIQYGFGKTVAATDFDTAVDQVTAALQVEGFGVLTEIDVKATLKKKLDAEFRKYKILGACNPVLAHKALTGESHIGLLLPCNVVVQQHPSGEVEVSIADPKMMFTMVQRNDLESVAEEAEARLRRVLDALD
jgi:uncharacterized protein (DUF302 family)